MLLSILICTIPERQLSFDILTESLLLQIKQRSDVQIIYDRTAKGEVTIGTKRQLLLERAEGEYILFIDDDEVITYWYIDSILKALENKPDCVSLNIPYILNGQLVGMCHHSKRYSNWHQVGDKYFRGITPNNPVKKELALKAGFKDISFGEDKDYSDRITPLCKSETEIKEIVYFYTTENKTPKNEKYGIR